MRKPVMKQIEEAAKSAKQTNITPKEVKTIYVEVRGRSALIQNNFSQKALEQMLRKHMGISVERERKKPREVIEASKIKNLDGAICIPPTAFKRAMLSAAANVKGTMKPWQLRTSLFVEGSSIPIKFDKEVPRMDMVRTSGMNRVPDVRFRASYEGWSARFGIQYSDTVEVQSVIDLLGRAGSVGVGEWRPEKNGTFGTFGVERAISTKAEQAEVMRACMSPLVQLQIPVWAMDAEIDADLLKRIASGEPDEEGEEQDEPKKSGTKG